MFLRMVGETDPGHRSATLTTVLSDQSLPFNSLTNKKILDWSKLKGFADDKINVIENLLGER